MSESSKTFITSKHVVYTLLVLLSIAFGALVFLPWPMNMIPFGIIFGLLFVLLNFKYPMVGVYLYMFIFFFKPQDWTSVQLPYEKVIALVIILTLLINITFKDKKFELYAMDKAFLAFMAVCFISIMFAGDIELAWDTFFKFFKVFLVYVFASRIANTEKKFNSIVWLYIGSLIFTVITVSFNYYTTGGTLNMGIQRAGGIGEGGADPNTIANTLVIGIPFIYFLLRHYKSMAIRTLFIGLMFLSVWTIILTGSRGGMLGVIVVVMLLALSTRFKVVTTFIAIMLLGIFIVIMPDQYKERFTSIFSMYESDQTGAAESAQGRVDGLVKGFVFLSQRPLFGVGIGNFKWQNRVQYGKWLDSHNLLGKLVGELGLVGLICFGFLIYTMVSSIQMIKYIYHRFKWKNDFNWYIIEATTYSLIIMAYQGLISHNLFRDNWYIFACFIVIITAITNERLKNMKSENPNEDETGLPAVTE